MTTPPPTAPAAQEHEAVVGEVERFLADLVADLAPDRRARPGPGRPRVLPALALWGGLLVCVLRGWRSQRALWRLLSGRGLWSYPRFPVTDQAVYKRLAEEGAAPLARLFAQVTRLLAARLDRYAARDLARFATEVLVLDETTLDPVARSLPALRGTPPGDAALLPGKLAGVFDVRRQVWRHLVHRPDARRNEKLAARDLLAWAPPGSLVLADLGYFGFAWFDELTERGRWWVSRLRKGTSYELRHVFYADGETLDALVWLGAHRADRAKHAVRLVQFRHGPTLHRYLTNVTDPHQLPLADIARLYARRWDIELAVKLVKRELKLHLLWSAKEAVLLQQVWAVLVIAQVLQALRLEIAGRAGVDPFEVSLPLLVEYLPQWAADGIDPVAFVVAEGRRLGFIRPSTRTTIAAPAIPPDHLIPPPPDLACVRSPRYAGRKCGPRGAPTK